MTSDLEASRTTPSGLTNQKNYGSTLGKPGENDHGKTRQPRAMSVFEVRDPEEIPLLDAKLDTEPFSDDETTVFRRKGDMRTFSSFVLMSRPFMLLGPNISAQDQEKIITGHNGQPKESDFAIDKPTKKRGLKSLSGRNKLLIAMLAVANFCSSAAFSCIPPFYPGVAAEKGASVIAIGLVFGVYQLVIFLVSPIFGRIVPHVGSNFLYSSGICVGGTTSFLFGLLVWSPNGPPFIGCSFAVRIFEALGTSAFLTASNTIVAQNFPERIATIMGLLQTFNGIGLSAGPVLGGILYEIGGFPLPFWTIGVMLIVAGLLSGCVLPKQKESPPKLDTSVLSLCRVPSICVMCFAVFVASFSIAFVESTFQLHLAQFHLTPIHVGLMFFLSSGVFAILAPFWGCLIDRYNAARKILLFGCCCGIISLNLVGPTPLLASAGPLWVIIIGTIVLGCTLSTLFVPAFQQCIAGALRAGFPDTLETSGLVAGIYTSSVALGGFMGPTIGSILVGHVDFSWAASAISLLHVALGFSGLWLIFHERKSVAAA